MSHRLIHSALNILRTALALCVISQTAWAQASTEAVVNLYSARHYQTDERLYTEFTRQTGIRINRIEAGDEALLERLRSEGPRSPADVLLLVDAARLWRAQIDGLFQPVQSTLLSQRIPQHLQGKDDGQGPQWFAFSTRARVIVVNPTKIDPALAQRYEDLARPELRGKVCSRSASSPYMLSLIGALSEHWGIERTEAWARGVVANFARPPRGGDTDQIKAVASGECAVALTNTYYLARLQRSNHVADRDIAARVRLIWPNQDSFGTHMNVTGGGVLKHAPHREAALRFLEYLASDTAQEFLAEGNNEWPVVASAARRNPVLQSWGSFKADALSIASVGRAQIQAARIADRVGWR
jgi:iron(III) transport system substrate-binding protein